MSPGCSSLELPVPSGVPGPALPLSLPGGAGSGKPREAEPGRDFPGTAAGARRAACGGDEGKRGAGPGGAGGPRPSSSGQGYPRQRENGSQGKGAERSRGLKFLCLGYPSQRKGPGVSLAPAGPGLPLAGHGASWGGGVGKIQVGETFVLLEGRGDSQSQRWRLHPFPCRWEVPYFLCCHLVLSHPATLPLAS